MESFCKDKYDMVKLKFKNNSGVSTLIFLFVVSTVIFIGQIFLFMDQQNVLQYLVDTQNTEAKLSLLENLETLVADELVVRNSRFNTNINFYRCLFATPTPCDETQTYDLILFSPNPPILYSGGAWPPPTGMSIIAGGLTLNPVFYTRAAGICPQAGLTAPTAICPLQAIIRFQPLCGGTVSEPRQQAIPGRCAGPATGFDITIGVGVLWRGELKYRNDTSAKGDARSYRIKSNSLLN